MIKWEAVDYITTEFTVDELHRIKRTGTLILRMGPASYLLGNLGRFYAIARLYGT
ncbi:MAG: hypothetical protein ACFFAX_01250 [Promethearchaeota archaeon]